MIGKELRALLKPEPEQPESLRAQLERLRELESPLVPADEGSEKYLELAEHYRSAKLDTKNRAARYLLETLEHSYRVLAQSTSYRVLAQSTVVLRRSKTAQNALAKFHK